MVETSGNGDSTVARRQLSRELKRLRLAAGISAEHAADELGISLATISRIENAKTTVSVGDTRTMCALYGKPDLADALVALSKASKIRSWWRQYSDVIPEWFDIYIGLEQAASTFRRYEAQLVPGILQTEGYARTLIRADRPEASDEDINRRVQLRLKRQSLLTREPHRPRWIICLDEAIVHRPIGGVAVMREQLRRLLEAADLPNVTIGIIPFEVGEHAGVSSGPFILLDFPKHRNNRRASEPTTVYVEGFTGALCTDDQVQITKYQTAFEAIQQRALGIDDSKIVIERAIKEMKKK